MGRIVTNTTQLSTTLQDLHPTTSDLPSGPAAWPIDPHPFEGISESAQRLMEELKNRQDEARNSIAVAPRKQKTYDAQKRKLEEFEVGDLVILKMNLF